MVEIFRYNSFSVLHIQTSDDAYELAANRLELPKYPALDRAGSLSGYLSQFLPLTAVIEYPYVDKDWTSLLSLHYASAFGQYPRSVVRVHLFQGLVPEGASIFDGNSNQKSYIGFFTVYPSRPRCIGRTLFDVGKIGASPGTLWCRNEVHLAGQRLVVNAFPFSGQDAKVVCCAHIAMWDIIRYYSTKYGFYGEFHQGDVAQLCEDARVGRAIPTEGLYYTQISAGFNALRLRPAVYAIDPPDYECSYLQRVARGYLRSGIPVVLAGAGHAIAAVGLKDPDLDDSEIIVNDDNFFPYGRTSETTKFGCRFTLHQLQFVFAPLYSKIVVPYETAEKMANGLSLSTQWGCAAVGLTTPLSQRTFLTSSKTYKETLSARPSAGAFERFVTTSPLPKFVWVAELYDPSEPATVVAEYVIDATTSEHDETSFLYLRYAHGFYHNDRFAEANSDSYISFWPTAGGPTRWERFPGNLSKTPTHAP